MLFLAGRQAEIRPLKSGKGYRFRAPGHVWTTCRSKKGAVRRSRKALVNAAKQSNLPPILWREVAFYDNMETGGTMGHGIEALDLCYGGKRHNLFGTGTNWYCTDCHRAIDQNGPNMPRVDQPLFTQDEVEAYDKSATG